MKIQIKTYVLHKAATLKTKILAAYIHKFWSDVFDILHSQNNNIHLLLMVKVEYNDPALGYKTLANLRKVNFSDRYPFIHYLTSSLGHLTESYKVHPINKIVFSYIVKEGLASGDRMLLQSPVYKVQTHKYNTLSLPLTMDPLQYGEVISSNPIDGGVRYIIENNYIIYSIDN